MKKYGILLVFAGGVALLLQSAMAAALPGSPRPEVQKNFKQLIETRSCVNCDLAGVNLVRMDLGKVNLQGANLAGARLNLANLAGANLRNANLQGAELGGADLAGADLRGANLTGAVVEGAYFGGTQMSGQVVSEKPYQQEGLPGVEEKVYVRDETQSKPTPYTQEVVVEKRQDFEETPPVVEQSPEATAMTPSSVEAAGQQTTASKKLPTMAKAKVPADAVARAREASASQAAAKPPAPAVAPAAKTHGQPTVARQPGPPVEQQVQEQDRETPTQARSPKKKAMPAGLAAGSAVAAMIDQITMDQEQPASQAPEEPEQENTPVAAAPSPANKAPVHQEVAQSPAARPAMPQPAQQQTAEPVPPAVPPAAPTAPSPDGGLAVAGESDKDSAGTPPGKATAESVAGDVAAAVVASLPATPEDKARAALLERLLDDNRCPECDLAGVDLKGKDLEEADLERANLAGADLRAADLSDANLKGADLHGANLQEADLRGADLYRANLQGADLTGARLDDVLLDDANLSGVRGLGHRAGSGQSPAETP